MGKKHKSFPNEDKDKRIKGQRERIKELEREIKRLKGQLKTLNEAFKKSAEYMSDESGPIPVEKLIKDAQSHKALKDSKKDVEDSMSEKERVRQKWAAWNKQRSKKSQEDEE